MSKQFTCRKDVGGELRNSWVLTIKKILSLMKMLKKYQISFSFLIKNMLYTQAVKSFKNMIKKLYLVI